MVQIVVGAFFLACAFFFPRWVAARRSDVVRKGQSGEHFDSTFRPAVVVGFRLVFAIIGLIALVIGLAGVA
jgi:hypothetical protein